MLSKPSRFLMSGCLGLAVACSSGTGGNGGPESDRAGGSSGSNSSGGSKGGSSGGSSSDGGKSGSGSGGSSTSSGSSGGSSGSSDGGKSGGSDNGGSSGGSDNGGKSGGSDNGGSTGSAMDGGSASGGSSGSTPMGDGGGGKTGDCKFTGITAMPSPKMGTVGIVTWGTDLAGMTEAHIDFGLDTQYGYTAPVDLKEPMYKTLLVGMKPSKMYHYQIVAKGPSGSCSSGDQTIMTGTVSGGKVNVSPAPSAASGWNFFLYSHYYGSGAQIIDKDGDTVWSWPSPGECSGARMSWDGKYVWLNSDNYQGGSSTVHLVSIDGMTDQNLSGKFPNANHMLGPTPDGVVFVAGTSGPIREYKLADGSTREITTTQKLGIGGNHQNNITYNETDDTIVLSDLDSTTITKFKRADGMKVWQINTGGPHHGLHSWFEMDKSEHLLFYSNPSTAIEYVITGGKGMQVWSGKSPGSTSVMGDVQRLPNGNTIIAASPGKNAVEVDKAGKTVRSLPVGSTGFTEARLSMYGPPPLSR